MKDTLGILLAGGAGERLYPLTRDRAKPAVTFGGIYRIIDITLSNCVNSGLRRVFILTQYKALSLNRQIREGWNIFGREIGEFIEILPPMKRVSENWYMGTADAVYQNIYSIGSEQPKYVLILSGDHIYKMNYERMLQAARGRRRRRHRRHPHSPIRPNAVISAWSISTASIASPASWKSRKQTDLRSPYDPTKISASMGIYIFNTDVLIPVLLKDAEDPESSHDFGKNILPKMLGDYRVFSFNFVDENKKEALYWRDVGTLEAYYEANMDLVSVSPVFNLYDEAWPIRTHQRQYPPAKFVFAESGRMGHALDSLVSSGLHHLRRLGAELRALSRTCASTPTPKIESSILFSHVNVGRSCRIRKAIIDRDVHIPEGTTIGYDAEADRERYFVTESGITVVTRDYSLFENPVTVDYFTSE